MSSNNNPIREQMAQEDALESGFPGHLLKAAREERGLSQQELARQLHLTSRVIEAIEVGDFDTIPSAIFARGYIRSYARHVGLDGDGLVAAFDGVYGAPDNSSKPASTYRKSERQAKPSDTWVKLFSLLLVVGLVALAIIWWQGQNGLSQSAATEQVTVDDAQGQTQVVATDELDLASLEDEVSDSVEPSPAEAPAATEAALAPADPAADAEAQQPQPEAEPTAATDTTAAAQATASDADADEPNAEVSQSQASAEPAPAAESSASAEPTAEAAADASSTPGPILAEGFGLLVMAFDKDCWVEVKDGDGNMVLTDLLGPGARVELPVKAPVQVLLGRATAVSEISFAGQGVDLARHTRKDIARVTLKL